jgi:NAD+ synthase (glutamine-hydrolysing)
MLVGPDGDLVATLPSFEESVRIVDTADARGGCDFVPEDRAASVFRALVLGLRDYVRKCGFEKAVVGLSGGIDSAVTCSIAASALGAENVLGVSMPSPYSSGGSIEDSRALAQNLGIRFEIVSIDEVYSSFLSTLERFLGDPGVDITEENIQARIRGNILMALSNEFGSLVLSTGNKSELAVGYCTLYGDMSGGLAVISDVPKTMVYDIAEHINAGGEVIPRATIVKPPSAELRPDQLDQDTLPPYETLDLILDLYVDRGMSLEQIVSHGVERDVATRVIRDVNRSEYKRRQAAPGLRVTSKAFGAGRRMPIAAVYEP